jgi:hypothetical protein
MYADDIVLHIIHHCIALRVCLSVQLRPFNSQSPLSASAAAPGIVVAVSGIASGKLQYNMFVHACSAFSL